MENDEVEYEEDRLGVAWARTRDSGSVISASATTLNGKTAAANVLTIGRKNVPTQTLPRWRLTRRGKPRRTRTGTPNTTKNLQSKAFGPTPKGSQIRLSRRSQSTKF